MKQNNQHIIKKSYARPVIEEVLIDVAISLQNPTGDPNEDDPIVIPPDPAPPAPKYSTEYKSESPFGGAEPRY